MFSFMGFMIFHLPFSRYLWSSQGGGFYFQFKLLLLTNANGTDNCLLHYTLSRSNLRPLFFKSPFTMNIFSCACTSWSFPCWGFFIDEEIKHVITKELALTALIKRLLFPLVAYQTGCSILDVCIYTEAWHVIGLWVAPSLTQPPLYSHIAMFKS